ncbi:LacI family DNA-binding transcriptional regulator [Treponema sp. OMZ 840]|uniref:LacI family DNA-binding transcriptional regulator n=1 Tax=Treponema sp. OMZ 840 TaxID=244313 RepID=UPI003D8D3551
MNTEKQNKNIYSIRDIAQLSGVSIATLSRYFNGQSVRKANQEKISAVLEKTNYRPNIAARFMKGRSTGLIGLILPEITHPFFATITEGVIEEARKNKQLVLCGSSAGSLEVEKQVIDQFSQSILDGLIYIPIATAENIPAIENFRNLPLVVAGRKGILPGVTHVFHDGEKGGYLSTKYLLQLGRKRIGFIASFWDPPCTNTELFNFMKKPASRTFSSIDRFRGYIKALKEANIPYSPDLVAVTGYTHESGINAATAFINRLTDCNGVIAMTQAVANGCAAHFKSQGYSVPEDISIILFDSHEKRTDYSYTNIELHLFKMGQESVKALNAQIAGEKPQDLCLDVALCIHGSTTLLHK